MADATHFEVGDEVEVTSPIHNMRGTTFPAKIVAKFRTKSKFKVEYNRVKARIDRKISGGHKGGKAALREEVDAALLRPPPPRESDYRFKLGDVVDAFFCGGWWEGVVVSDVLVDNTLGVYFRFAKEKFEFEPEELRLHREWVKGSWVPPLQQGDVLDAKEPKTGMNEELIEGTTVEVCTDEDGFQGAWFAANIVKVMEKDKFFIRYKTIKTDDNKELLTEEVDAKHIRPRPPKVVAAESFSLTEDVDAFYNDGWWEGVIRKVLPGRRYKVYFKGTDDELMFQHSDLRPRQDWMDRTWVMASQALKH
ncbi:protein AGENET DOMAIN (AGD)-CONTAINING P1-like isoform X3 [Malus sylvestris]|uniref:protein AGENET DOMAIN (AGD)-CONTAINING P1-like isoform X3 n=1 Tax=Malus sylvestris TaxID=3752 RepID=UPI0021ACEC89|nr:protein AGENET DOMAIN (AGD)-CONTAINING P1-like isoform X3 [Malus sylvestris]